MGHGGASSYKKKQKLVIFFKSPEQGVLYQKRCKLLVVGKFRQASLSTLSFLTSGLVEE